MHPDVHHMAHAPRNAEEREARRITFERLFLDLQQRTGAGISDSDSGVSGIHVDQTSGSGPLPPDFNHGSRRDAVLLDHDAEGNIVLGGRSGDAVMVSEACDSESTCDGENAQ